MFIKNVNKKVKKFKKLLVTDLKILAGFLWTHLKKKIVLILI